MADRGPAYVAESLDAAAIKQAGYFDPVKVQRLVGKCRQQEGRLVSEHENMALVAILSAQLLDHPFIRQFPVFSDNPLRHTVVHQQEAAV